MNVRHKGNSLYDKMLEYSLNGCYPMHMPGHKRNTEMLSMVNPYSIDYTEIDGLDNLHDAEGIIQETMAKAAKIYGSQHTDYLINGSTAGILAGISAAVSRKDTVLIARNSHKSVYHAVFLNELNPIYLYPEWNSEFGVYEGVTLEEVKRAIEAHNDVKAVVITSPTYEGFLSDVASISEYLHEHSIPLIVDEAHGAHLGFSDLFPDNSITKGADIVIHSVHKTLPSFTQTALIHVNSCLVSYSKVKEYLSIYQSSSPSYLLMSSIDNCMNLLLERGEDLFEEYRINRMEFQQQTSTLKNIKLYYPNDLNRYDISKLLISVKGTDVSGKMIYNTLKDKYKIQMEMMSLNYVLGMTSIADTKEGFIMLQNALIEIDSQITKEATQISSCYDRYFGGRHDIIVDLSPYNAYNRKKKSILLNESEGYISGEYVYLYPPGSPILVPGERISHQLITCIQEMKQSGLSIKGLGDSNKERINVIE